MIIYFLMLELKVQSFVRQNMQKQTKVWFTILPQIALPFIFMEVMNSLVKTESCLYEIQAFDHKSKE